MGKIHSFQSLGTVDGPGIRFVVFFQGCNLRCGCCHNPDTWEFGVGKEMTAEQIVARAERFKEYFGHDGGITLSGGEPLCQAEFALDVLRLAKERGLNTCIDTSGDVLNSKVKELLHYVDRVLLDVKYMTDELYKKHVGCSIRLPLEFLAYLDEIKMPTTIRQVIIPSLNDTEEDMEFLNSLADKFSCIDKIELLPFKKICQTKYDSMGIKFPFENMETPTHEDVEKLRKKLKLQ